MIETPILWPPDAKSWVIWKDPDAGKDWGQEEKGMTEDEMVGWHLRLDGHEFEQTSWVGDGQGGLACCRPWDCKELDMTEQLNWTEQNMDQIWKIMQSEKKHTKVHILYDSYIVWKVQNWKIHRNRKLTGIFWENREWLLLGPGLLQGWEN